MAERYWLMKSEPDVFSIDDLRTEGVDYWDGVRNYQARNIMRDQMKVGDPVLFYHSNADPPGVAGVARIARAAYPDHTAFDPESKYFDEKSDPDDPRWLMVDVEFVEKFATVVPLALLQETPGLEDMMVTKRGMRLSVQPVKAEEWAIVTELGKTMTPTAVAEFLAAAKARKKATPSAAGKASARKKTAAEKGGAKKKKAGAKKKKAGAKKKKAGAKKKKAGAKKKKAGKSTPARTG